MALDCRSIIGILGLLLNLQTVSLVEQILPYSVRALIWNETDVGFTIDLELEWKCCNLDISMERNLENENFVLRYEKNFGPNVTIDPELKMIQTCEHRGNIRHVPNSYVKVDICGELDGVVLDNIGTYHFTNLLNSSDGRASMNTEKMHIVPYGASTPPVFACGDRQHSFSFKNRNGRNETDGIMAERRLPLSAQNLSESATYFVEMVLVVDYDIFIAMNKDVDLMHRRYQDIINAVNELYQKTKLFVSVIEIDYFSAGDRVLFRPKDASNLDDFGRYVARIFSDHENVDNVQLLTFEPLYRSVNKVTVPVRGVAWNSGMCNVSRSFGIVQDMVNDTSSILLTSRILANQLARNLGARSDERECFCLRPECLKDSPSISLQKRGSCCYEMINLVLANNSFPCLNNKPIREFVKKTKMISGEPGEFNLSTAFILFGIGGLVMASFATYAMCRMFGGEICDYIETKYESLRSSFRYFIRFLNTERETQLFDSEEDLGMGNDGFRMEQLDA